MSEQLQQPIPRWKLALAAIWFLWTGWMLGGLTAWMFWGAELPL